MVFHLYIYTKGDVLEIGMPSGSFVLNANDNKAILISGGVGITPLLSMYHTITKSTRKVDLIQCVKNSSQHAFRKEINLAKSNYSTSTVIYDSPLESDVLGTTHDFEGYLTADIIQNLTWNESTEFYFCGPKAFMMHVTKILRSIGVERNKVFFEFFGPEEELSVGVCPSMQTL